MLKHLRSLLNITQNSWTLDFIKNVISRNQTIEHWLVECPYFNDLRDEFSSILTVIINQFSTRTTTTSSTNIETSNLNNSDNILDSNFIDNSNLVNNIVYNNSSVCKEVFKFLLG